jgi:hypothetical protein
VFDVLGSAQAVALIRVDDERNPFTDCRYKLPPNLVSGVTVSWSPVEGKDGTVARYTGAEQGSVPPSAGWLQEKVGVMCLEPWCGSTPCSRINNGRTYGGRPELLGIRRGPQCGVATRARAADDDAGHIESPVSSDRLDGIDAVGHV